MGVTTTTWVEGPAGLPATRGVCRTASSELGAEGSADSRYSDVDAFCSKVDDDLRAGERRSPLLGLFAVVTFWTVILIVGDAVITTFA